MRHRKSPDDDLLEQLNEWLDETCIDIKDTLFLSCVKQRSASGDKLYTLHLLGDQVFKEPKTAIDLKLALGLYGRPVIPVIGRYESGYSDFALVLSSVQGTGGRCIVVL
jgi:hypothetical protein